MPDRSAPWTAGPGRSLGNDKEADLKTAIRISLSVGLAILVQQAPATPDSAQATGGAPSSVRVVEDFGASCDGVSDDAAQINAASAAIGNVGGGEVIFPANATCNIGIAITLRSNVTYRGSGRSVVRGMVADMNEFVGYGVKNIVVRDLMITNSATYGGGSAQNPHPAGINLYASEHCLVSNVEMTNISFTGVYLADTSHSKIEKMNAHDWAETDPKMVGNPSDVAIMLNSNDNIVENSELSGGGWHGVMIMNPYAPKANPLRNIVRNNHIGRHKGYGVLIYIGYPEVDNFSQVTDNVIEHIEGSVIGNSSGACIYDVGGGGALIARNRISDCSAQSNNLTLAPGGVGINGIAEWMKPVRIIDNKISDIPRYSGVYIASSPGGAVVMRNAIHLPRLNPAGSGIAAVNSDRLIFEKNRIEIDGAAPQIAGISVIASSKDVNDVQIASNTIIGAAHSCIRTVPAGDAHIRDFEVRGNVCEAGAASNIALRLSDVVRARILENRFSGPGESLVQTDSTEVRYAGNMFESPKATLLFIGKNDGSVFEHGNRHSGAIVDRGSGLIVEDDQPQTK